MLLKRSAVIDGGYPLVRSSSPTHITFGKEGAYSISNNETLIGSYKALVCDDNALLENLVSPNPLVDSGHIITLHKNGGIIQHPHTGRAARIMRDGPRWKVWLHDIKTLSDNNNDLNINTIANLNAYSRTTRTISLSERKKIIDLHERLAHASVDAMCNAVSGSKPTWRQNPKSIITASTIRKVFKEYNCIDCTLAKRNIASPSVNEKTQYSPGETVSVDPVGPINPPTKEGYKYFILFKCVSTGYLHAFAVKSKDCFLRCLTEVVDWYKARGYSPRILRSDNDTVILSQETQNYLVKSEIIHQLSAPYRHFQNAVEREVQTVTKGVSLLLHSQPWLPARLWHLALFHYVRCRNNTPNVHNKYKTPSHVINVTATDLTNCFSFTFGDVVAVRIPKELRTWKFDLRNDVGIYVGQPEGSVDTHHVYYPDDDTVKTRGSVYKVEISNEKFLQYFQRRKDIRTTNATTIPTEILSFPPNEEPNAETNVPPLAFPLASDDADPIPTIRKSSRIKRTNTRYNNSPNDHNRVTGLAAKITSKSALKGNDCEKWKEALSAETNMIFNGGTLVEETPAGIRGVDYHIIHSTMQMKIKLKDDGTVQKYKARLCARGDMLAGKTPDEETYSPTIGALSFAAVHQIAILDSMHTCSVDVVGAYLYENYPDSATPLYLKIEPHVAEALGLDPYKTYRIKKYLYGLPDSGRAYYKGYSSHLEAHDYKRTLSDPCLFVKITNECRTYIWIHVDDTFVASTCLQELAIFEKVIGLKYDYTVEADVESYLGLHRTKLKDGGIRLTQPKLLTEIFEKFDPSKIPGTGKVTAPQSNISDDNWDTTPFNRTEYLSLLGALIYLTKSRPDIATAISFAGTHSVNPTVSAYQELIRCVQYLWNTKDAGLVLHPGTAGAPLTLRCYVDASYLTHDDSKSHTGYCLSFGTIGTFYSKSSKQTLVTTSSTHAEMRALYQLVLDIIFLIHLCEELGRPITLPAIVLEDNQPVIDLSKELTKRSKKCKHFLMLINFIREQIQQGLIELQKVPTEDNLADLLTKIITGSQFSEKAEQLLGLNWNELLQEFSDLSNYVDNEFA